MTQWLAFLILISSLVLIYSCREEPPPASQIVDTKEYRLIAAEFMGELKNVLLQEMKKGGPELAVSVCSDTAQLLTQKFAEVKNIRLKRVSLKTRNQLNDPDVYEKNVLNQFEKLQAERSLTDTTETVAIFNQLGKRIVRYMKPIILQPPCLNCHGDNVQIGKKTSALISSKYPDDRAIDYKIGDVRGAISITKILN